MTFILFHASDSFFPYAFCLCSFQPSPCVRATWQVHYIGTCLRCALIRGVRLSPPPVTKWRSLDCAAPSFLRASVSYFYSISHRPPETHQTAPPSLLLSSASVCLRASGLFVSLSSARFRVTSRPRCALEKSRERDPLTSLPFSLAWRASRIDR